MNPHMVKYLKARGHFLGLALTARARHAGMSEEERRKERIIAAVICCMRPRRSFTISISFSK